MKKVLTLLTISGIVAMLFTGCVIRPIHHSHCNDYYNDCGCGCDGY